MNRIGSKWCRGAEVLALVHARHRVRVDVLDVRVLEDRETPIIIECHGYDGQIGEDVEQRTCGRKEAAPVQPGAMFKNGLSLTRPRANS